MKLPLILSPASSARGIFSKVYQTRHDSNDLMEMRT
jgi:hypothetical protein